MNNRFVHRSRHFLLLSAMLCLSFTRADAVVLYDGALGTAPEAQDWAYFTNPLFSAESTIEFLDNGVRLDTTKQIGEQAGYFSEIPILFEHPRIPVMDLSLSPITVLFRSRIVSGFDLPDTDPTAFDDRNRGGLALIVVTDNGHGIEFQFQHDRVVALDDSNAAFPVGEAVDFDASKIHEYEIRLAEDGYRLTVEDEVLLQGQLRDYSPIAPSPPFDFPYRTPNFIFFGDNTGRAGAISDVSFLSVSLDGDCDESGLLDQEDLRCVATLNDRDLLLSAINSPLGDLDFDGNVAFSDFLILSRNFGAENVGYIEGNIDLNESVSFSDFLVFSLNFGREISNVANLTDQRSVDGTSFMSVPEPSAMSLVSLLGICMLAFVRDFGI